VTPLPFEPKTVNTCKKQALTDKMQICTI
jgi:hypothetical protein